MTPKDYLAIVSDRGCVLCKHLGLPKTPAAIHHPREGEGTAQRASDWLAIGLCREHHQGDSGWHGLGKRAFYARYRLDELDLLAMTVAGVLGDQNKPVQLAAPAKPSRPIQSRPLRSPRQAAAPAALPKILPRRIA